MSKILRVAHSFTRKGDNPAAMIEAMSKRLRFTDKQISVANCILTTKNGHACRNVDVSRKLNVSYYTISSVKNILEYVGAIRRTDEFTVVNWSKVRRIIATPMNEPLPNIGKIDKVTENNQTTVMNAINGISAPVHSRTDRRGTSKPTQSVAKAKTPKHVAKVETPKIASSAPSFTAESIQALIKAEVHAQMTAMVQRMGQI